MTKEEQLMTNFRDLFNKMAWLNKPRMEECLSGYIPSEVHTIEVIGNHADTNVRKLAESLYMTRGAASKIAKRLIKKGYIERFQKPDNKKEIYFKLTNQGKEIFKTHEAVHKEFQERDKVVFDHITDEQFNDMLNFIKTYHKHLDKEIDKQGMTIQ